MTPEVARAELRSVFDTIASTCRTPESWAALEGELIVLRWEAHRRRDELVVMTAEWKVGDELHHPRRGDLRVTHVRVAYHHGTAVTLTATPRNKDGRWSKRAITLHPHDQDALRRADAVETP